MRLVYKGIDLEIELEEGYVDVITIENKASYVDFLTNLYNQYNNLEGNIILSDNTKEISIAKSVDIIFNPIVLDCNDKKVINKLYTELKEKVNERLQEESSKINSLMIEYLDKVIETVPYNLTFTLDMDITSLFKSYEIKLSTNPESLLEKIIEYMKAYHRVCNINVFFFVNMYDYLSYEEIDMLYECILYEKIHLIIIENRNGRCAKSSEKHWIIDDDLCIIEPDELTV